MSTPTFSAALDLLQSIWGYSSFRAPQGEIAEHVASGGSALVLMPTGGGKSLCYQLPALLRQGVGVVVSPLIALMQDQVDAMRQLGVRAAFLNSSLSAPEVSEVTRLLRAGELDLLYIAPERLLQEGTLRLLESLEVALFAIDEAHCVSQWGHDFRPEYQGLGVLARRFGDVPRIALTATADERTRADIVQVLGLEEARQFISSFDRPNIQYRVESKQGAKKQLLNFIHTEHASEAGIVYCLSRKSVEETAHFLQEQGVSALPYHAGLSHQQRQQTQQRFLREEGLLVVATVAFGMGIDKPDVRFVAHLDMPKSMEGYYQETGRAGRDGLPSVAWMVYGLSDVVSLRQMLGQSNAPEWVQRVEAQKLNALLAYCESVQCRRKSLLAYFGEISPDEPCGNCDNCLNPPRVRDALREAQMALSAAVRVTKEVGGRVRSFGAGHLSDIVQGKATEKVVQWHHEQLPTFGVGKDISSADWNSIFRQLVSMGYLEADEHSGLRPTAASKALLRGEVPFMLREDTRPIGKQSTGKNKDKLRKSGSSAPTTLSPQATPVYEALRAWRLAEAQKQGVAAFIIFDNKTLAAIAELRPSSLSTLGTVSGVGRRKLEQYGQDILEVLTGLE